MVAQLKVFANKFIEIFQNNLSMQKYGVKVVNSYHKKLDSIMFLKIKMSYKSTKAKLKDKSKSKKLKKIKKEVKSNQQKRKKSEKFILIRVKL